jgi:glycosyltransferase involved in cell wall biosynthesis
MAAIDHGDMNAPDPFPLLIDDFPRTPRSLRVALVSETYPPEINGVALTMERLVLGLQARQHDLQVVRPRQARSEQPAAQTGLEQVLMRSLPIPNYPQIRFGLPAKSALLRLWSLRRPDLVHIATEGPLGWSALQAARKLKLPVSTDFHTNFHAYSHHYGVGWLQKPIAAYLRKFHNTADCTLVPTVELQTQLQALGFERLLVIGRGVDTQRFHPAKRSAALRAQWGVGERDCVALFVSRLAPEKNLVLLAQAHAAMQQVQPGCKLVVVGDGPARGQLQALAPAALLCGMQTGDELATHYASADVFLFPSQTETYGNVIPEAMASGLAVLAYDYAAPAELIDSGHHGLLAPFGDAAAFIEQARQLAAQPVRAEALRRAARERAQTLDWGQIAQQFESLWLRMVSTGPGSA